MRNTILSKVHDTAMHPVHNQLLRIQVQINIHILTFPVHQLKACDTRFTDCYIHIYLECAIISMNVALYGLPKDAPRTEEGWAILTSYEQSEPDYVFPQKGEDKQ